MMFYKWTVIFHITSTDKEMQALAKARSQPTYFCGHRYNLSQINAAVGNKEGPEKDDTRL